MAGDRKNGSADIIFNYKKTIMAKKVLEIKAVECFSSNKGIGTSNVTLALNVQQTDKGPASSTAIHLNIPDQKAAGNFEPGKKYTVTVTED